VRILLLSIENKRSFKVSLKKLRFLGSSRGKSSHQMRTSSQHLPKFRRAERGKSVETETNYKRMCAFLKEFSRKDHFLSMFLLCLVQMYAWGHTAAVSPLAVTNTE
jgi:hypothetical protein